MCRKCTPLYKKDFTYIVRIFIPGELNWYNPPFCAPRYQLGTYRKNRQKLVKNSSVFCRVPPPPKKMSIFAKMSKMRFTSKTGRVTRFYKTGVKFSKNFRTKQYTVHTGRSRACIPLCAL